MVIALGTVLCGTLQIFRLEITMRGHVGIIVLILISKTIANTNEPLDETQVTTSNYKPQTSISSSGEKRWTPVFPKIAHKFILTAKPTSESNQTTTVRSKNAAFKVIPKAVKMKSQSYWKAATTRRPLMKYTKFTVDPSTFKILANSQKVLSKDGKEIEKNFKAILVASKDSSEEESSEKYDKRDHKAKHKSWTSQFRKVHAKIIKDKMKNVSKSPISNFTAPNINMLESEVSSEEKEDRNEFIFVTPNVMKEKNVVSEDSDESIENTTTGEKELKRQTRSINVIEEENLGTTVSGFKFTGKVASLSNDLMFRNIHT